METRMVDVVLAGGLGSWALVAEGIVFVVCLLLFRRGFVGELGAALKPSLGHTVIARHVLIRAAAESAASGGDRKGLSERISTDAI